MIWAKMERNDSFPTVSTWISVEQDLVMGWMGDKVVGEEVVSVRMTPTPWQIRPSTDRVHHDRLSEMLLADRETFTSLG